VFAGGVGFGYADGGLAGGRASPPVSPLFSWPGSDYRSEEGLRLFEARRIPVLRMGSPVV